MKAALLEIATFIILSAAGILFLLVISTIYSRARADSVQCDKWGSCWNELDPGERYHPGKKRIYQEWRYPSYRQVNPRNNWSYQPPGHDYDH